MKSYLILLLMASIGCNSNNNTEQLSKKFDSLAAVNQKLNEQINREQYKKKTQDAENSKSEKTKTDNDVVTLSQESTASNKKFAFVLLVIEKREFNPDKWSKDNDLELTTHTKIYEKGYEYNTYNVVTKIQSYLKFDEDTEFKLLDEAQSNLKYNMGPDITGVKSRKCFIYDTYKKASLAREKYITDSN
jgi:hypothetical protein